MLYYFTIMFLILYDVFHVYMVVLGGNFTLGCGPGTDYPEMHIFQYMLACFFFCDNFSLHHLQSPDEVPT
jgi:hypothetical protein